VDRLPYATASVPVRDDRLAVASPHGHPALHALLAACGGFLIATLWFDLMFDTQVLGHVVTVPLPEGTIASIAHYYRRVTTDAHPMELLIGSVMGVTVLGSAWCVVRASPRALPAVALLAATAPIGLAAARIVANAVRLGARDGSLAEQSALARSIFVDHVFCIASMVVFTAIEVALAWRRAPSPD
jgi:hypothetical protein